MSLSAKLSLVVLALLAAVPAAATTYTWNDDQGGAWSDAARWTPSGVPGSADVAILPALASEYVVALDQAPAAAELHVATGAGIALGAYSLANVAETWNAGRLGGFRGVLDGTRLHNQAGGVIEAAIDGTIEIADTLENDGTILVGPNPENVLWISSSAGILGTGSVRLSGQATVNCPLERPQHDIWLSIGEGQTFAGAGDVWVPVKVYGRLLQDNVGGPELVLHTYLMNYGTIRVQDGGWINVDCPLVKQYGGTIEGNDGTFSLHVGPYGNLGTVDNLNGGTLVADGGDLHFTVGEMVAGNYQRRGDAGAIICDEYAWVQNPVVEAGAVLRIDGLIDASADGTTIANDGTILLRGTMNFGGPSTNHLAFTGTGQLVLDGGTLGSPIGCLVTNSEGHTITGCGTLAANIENLGTISVDCGSGGLVLKTQPIDNRGRILVKRGYLSVRNTLVNKGAIDGKGGTLKVEYGGKVDNRSGSMVAGAGNLFLGWKSPAATIEGGALTAVDGGMVQNVGQAVLTDVRLDQGTTLRTIAGATTRASGTRFANAGTNEVLQGGAFTVDAATDYEQAIGTTALSGGTFTAPRGLAVEGSLTGHGTVVANVGNAGEVAPDAAGLSIQGSYRQSGLGRLVAPLGGSAPVLRVSGDVTLDGTVVLRTTAGFTASTDVRYPVMSFGSRTGTFAHLDAGSSLTVEPVYEEGLFALAGTSVVGVPEPAALPRTLALVALSNGLRLELPTAADVDVRAYDVAGREVAALAHGALPAGVHPLALQGAALTRGIYFARATVRSNAGTEVRTARILSLR